MTSVPIRGQFHPGFEPVRAAFERNFDQHGDIGAAVAVLVDGEPVVHLWGGTAEPATNRPWVEDTIVVLYSVSKGVGAIACGLLQERGLLDLDAPVSSYWPEFATNGKERITVRQLLSHTAGLPIIDDHLSADEVIEGRKVLDALAAQAPLWEPGTRHGYHAVTYGWLVGETVRRAVGRSLGDVLATEVAAPLGLDLFLGLPEAEEARVAPIIDPTPRDPAAAMAAVDDPVVRERWRQVIERLNDPDSLMTRSHSLNGAFPGLAASFWNRRDVHAMELCSINAIADARSVARLFAACIGEVDGMRLLSDMTVQDITREVASGQDEVLPNRNRFASGLQRAAEPQCFYSEASFGHYGAAGALGFADPAYGIGFGYVSNHFAGGPAGDPRTDALVEALRESLGR